MPNKFYAELQLIKFPTITKILTFVPPCFCVYDVRVFCFYHGNKESHERNVKNLFFKMSRSGHGAVQPH